MDSAEKSPKQIESEPESEQLSVTGNDEQWARAASHHQRLLARDPDRRARLEEEFLFRLDFYGNQ